MAKLSESFSKIELGTYGQSVLSGNPYSDEIISDLRGLKGIKKYREMRDNSATIGALMYAIEQVLRDVDIKVCPANDSEEAKKEAEFVESVLDDMEHSLDDHIAEALSVLTFGFSWFEQVYKVRSGPSARTGKKKSKYNDGRIGLKKLAIRAPWTINKFEMDYATGQCLGVHQQGTSNHQGSFIPSNKSLVYRTTTLNGDPAGRSVLRNAYSSYKYLTSLQTIEAIAVERELHGVPVGRIPAEFLHPDASDAQKAVRSQMETILRDLKMNEQGYALIPSDVYTDIDGKPSNSRLMDIELITSNGSRSVDIDPIIRRYQHDIARSVMSEFLMLGSSSTGSYALSKSKTDLFLRSMESYIDIIVDTLNKQVVERLWEINGLDYDLMPELEAGDVAPHDLKELGSYLRNLNGANIDLSDQVHIINALLENAELPEVDEEVYQAKLDEEKAQAQERTKLELQAMAAPKPTPAPNGGPNG